MRRLFLTLMLLAILVVLIAGGVLLALNTGLGARYLRKTVNGLALEKAGLSLTWKSAHGSYLFNLTLESPVLATTAGDTLFTADRVEAWYWPWAFLKGPMGLSRVEVDRPVFRVPALAGMGSETGETPAAEGTAPSAGRGGGLPILGVSDVLLRDGRVEIVGEESLFRAVDGIQLRGAFQMGPEGGVDVTVRRLRAGVHDLDLDVTDLQGQVVIRGGRLWLIGVHARTRQTALTARGSLGLSSGTLTDLRILLEGNKIEELQPLLGGEWIGEGPVQIRARLLGDLRAPRFLVSGNGRIAGTQVDGFTAEGSYSPDRLLAHLRASSPVADSLVVDVDMDPRNGFGTVVARADSIRLRSSPADLPVRFAHADTRFEMEGFDVLEKGARLQLRGVGMEAFGFLADSVTTTIVAEEGRVRSVEPLVVNGRGYRLSARGDYDTRANRVDVTLSGSTDEPSQPFQFAGVPVDSGRVSLDLRVTGLADDPDVRGLLEVSRLRRKQIRVAHSSFQVDVARLRTGRLGTFRAELDSLQGSGEFALPRAEVAGRVRGDTITLSTVRGLWAEGNASLQGNITVTPDSVQAVLDEGVLHHRDITVNAIQGSFAVNNHDGGGAFGLSFDAGEGAAQLEGFRGIDKVLHISGDFQQLDLGQFSRSLEWPGHPAGIVDGQVVAHIGTHVDEMGVRVDIENPAIFDYQYDHLLMGAFYREGTVTVDTLGVTGYGTERMDVSGTVHLPGASAPEAAGRLDVDATIKDLQLAPFARYMPGHVLSGTLNGDLKTRGTMEAPTLDGRFTLVGGKVDTFLVEEAGLEVRYDGDRLHVVNGRLNTLGFTGSFEGSVPVYMTFSPFRFRIERDQPVSAQFKGDGDPAALTQPFQGSIESIEGLLTATVNVAGTLDAIDLSGRIQLQDGTLKPTLMGRSIQDIQLDLALKKDRIEIQRLTGRLPSDLRTKRSPFLKVVHFLTFGVFKKEPELGIFNVRGGVTIAEGGRPRLDLQLDGTRLGIADPTESMAIALDIPELTIASAPGDGHPIIQGRAVVLGGRADLGLLIRLASGAGAAGGASVEPSSTEMNIAVEIPANLRVVGGDLSQEADVELQGNLLIIKTPGRPLYVLGSMQTVPGRGTARVYGRRWTVDQGNLTFGSIEEIDPALDVIMSTLIQDVEVTLTLTGTVSEPNIQLSTDSPSLTSQGDILQFLALGMTGIGEQGGVGTAMRQVSTGYLEGAISRGVQGTFGVDTFDISGVGKGNLAENTQITVGKYYRRFYFRYTGGFTSEPNQGTGDWGVEYRLSRRFLVSGSRNRLGRYFLELKWKIEY